MKKVLLTGLVLVILLANVAHPFEFIDSKKSTLLGVNVGFGHGIGVAGHFELPPYGDLAILAFIPGFGMDLQIGLNDGFFVQNAICVRVKPVDTLPLIAKVGVGLGIRFGGAGMYIPVVVGADYFFTPKLAAMTTMTFGDGFRFTLGVGFGFGFAKEE
ncbi:MAG: hypothetical protein WC703_01995 [Candidatus Neomarinimicrobiota bacterium]